MIRFLDGPAAGVTLMLKRAPLMLRVTRQVIARTWDALDQLEDEPDADEEIHLYRLDSPVGSCHINCGRGRGKRASGWYPIAEYRHWPEAIADEHLRTNEAWRRWCTENQARLMKGQA